MSYQVKIPSCAFGGVGSIEKVKEVIKKEKSQKVVVFSDEGIKATGLLGILTARLDEAPMPSSTAPAASGPTA